MSAVLSHGCPRTLPQHPEPSAAGAAATGQPSGGQETYMCRDFWALAASSLEL